VDDRVRARLELRRSSAARPHRNRYRESKVSPVWDDWWDRADQLEAWWLDVHDYCWTGEEDECE
jgi:hypothetical protein